MKFNTSVLAGLLLASSGEVFCSTLLGRQPVDQKISEVAEKSSEKSAESPQEIEMLELFHQESETPKSPSTKSSLLYELIGKPIFTKSLFGNFRPQETRTYATWDDGFSTSMEDSNLKQQKDESEEPATTQSGIPNPSTVPYSFSNMFLTPLGEFPYSVKEQASNPQGINHVVENNGHIDVAQEDNNEDVVEVGNNHAIDEPQNVVVNRNTANVRLVLLNNAGNEVELDAKSKENVKKAIQDIALKYQTSVPEAQKMFGKMIRTLTGQNLKLCASFDGRELRPIDENAFSNLLGFLKTNHMMIENRKVGDRVEELPKDSSESSKTLKMKKFGSKPRSKAQSGTVKQLEATTPVTKSGPKKPDSDEDDSDIDFRLFKHIPKRIDTSASSTILSPENTLLADPSKFKFPWKALLLSAGGLALVAAIVSAVYIASQTIQDEESVDL